MWIWSRAVLTIPREVTYHAGLQQLVYSPVREMEKLRGALLGQIGPANLAAGTSLPLLGSRSVDVRAFFKRPQTATTLSIALTEEVLAYVNYVPGTGRYSVVVGFAGSRVTGDGYPPPNTTKFVDVLQLLPTDTHIDIRMFYDGSVSGSTIEGYWMDGRVAMTGGPTSTPRGPFNVSVQSVGGPASLINATAWNITSVWTTTEQVLATPALSDAA